LSTIPSEQLVKQIYLTFAMVIFEELMEEEGVAANASSGSNVSDL
jgi:hypothetical protein